MLQVGGDVNEWGILFCVGIKDHIQGGAVGAWMALQNMVALAAFINHKCCNVLRYLELTVTLNSTKLLGLI